MISVELSQDEWVMVVDLIAYHPYRKVSALMDKLQSQIMPQMQQQKIQPHNGEDTSAFTE